LDRAEELRRLRAGFRLRAPTLAVLYGRRRCGKSRLLSEALPARSIYYVGDDRESSLQRAALAVEVGRRIAGFDRAVYPDWAALFDSLWQRAPSGTVLAIDELPALVWAAPEVPSLLQKKVDARQARPVHLVLCGSSQRMMHGLVLDRTAPLFGRAREILRIDPLPVGWIAEALRLKSPGEAIEAYSVWGGIPRYWELAAEHKDLARSILSLVLDPLGVLHEEPAGLLLDDLRDTTQAASILALIGAGCHRPSEIAARLQKPATSLSRPLQRLAELGLVRREVPAGAAARDSKRALYRIGDPFLRFWFRFVEPNRSRLQARLIEQVMADVRAAFPHQVAEVWEDLARRSVPHLHCGGYRWRPAQRWWGPGTDRKPLEVDVVAESECGKAILVGEAKWSRGPRRGDPSSLLRDKAARLPLARGRRVVVAVWQPHQTGGRRETLHYTPADVLRVLR
jgi:hypothetical protein